MQPTPRTRPEDSREKTPLTPTALPCPVCAGPLVPLRGFARCVRCSFSLCIGCEGGEGPLTDGFGE